MKTHFRIGLFLFVIVIIYLLYSNMITNKLNNEGKSEAQNEISIPADTDTITIEGYYLYEKNGYIVVYCSDKKTPYEYTDIETSILPAELLMEIKNGKYMKNLEEVYGVLENYSS